MTVTFGNTGFVNRIRRRQFELRDRTQRRARNSVIKTNSQFSYIGEKIATGTNYTGVIFSIRFELDSRSFRAYCANLLLLEGTSGPLSSNGGPVSNIHISKVYWPKFSDMRSFVGGTIPTTESEPRPGDDLAERHPVYSPEDIANRCRLFLRSFRIKAVRKNRATDITVSGQTFKVKWNQGLEIPVSLDFDSQSFRQTRPDPVRVGRSVNRQTPQYVNITEEVVGIRNEANRPEERIPTLLNDVRSSPLQDNYYVNTSAPTPISVSAEVAPPANTRARAMEIAEANRVALNRTRGTESVTSIMREFEGELNGSFGHYFTEAYKQVLLQRLFHLAERYIRINPSRADETYNVIMPIPLAGDVIFTIPGDGTPLITHTDRNPWPYDNGMDYLQGQTIDIWMGTFGGRPVMESFIRFIETHILRIRQAGRMEQHMRNMIDSRRITFNTNRFNPTDFNF